MMKKKPVIGITPGDTAGIGPEIIKKAIASSSVHRVCLPVVIGDTDIVYPKFSRRGSGYAMECVRQAAFMALHGDIDAIVTAPICKEGIYKAGYDFKGHTDFLAHISGCREYSMMFAAKKIKVILVTAHTRLKDVAGKITRKAVERGLRHAFLGAGLMGIKRPKIGVCALNPHGAETGPEEERYIRPAAKKYGAEGPFSADIIFRMGFDIVVAMYHDQGLIPVKMLCFNEAVNVTLGLPFIRTSPDHGTAYDIAGKGIADPRAMINAVKLAAAMADEKKKMGAV